MEKEPLNTVGESSSVRAIKMQRVAFVIASLVLLVVSALFVRYLLRPAPLPELILPNSMATYPPHYLFSIYGVDRPVGIALSPDGGKIYVSESGGERLIKVFDRQGLLLGSISPEGSLPGQRSPVYLAVDNLGYLYISDRIQQAVLVFDPLGRQVDSLMSPAEALQHKTKIAYGLPSVANFFYTSGGTSSQYSDIEEYQRDWSPLGLRFDSSGRLYITDVAAGSHCVYILNLENGGDLSEQLSFGSEGTGEGKLNFPNSAMPDSQGRIYISDGNNWRISVWGSLGRFLYHFGQAGSEQAVKLPRGLYVDHKDRLYVVDAVGHQVKVFDVSGERPVHMFDFGELGIGDGLFQYPNDIVMDLEGRLYVVDRENNRIQVWSY